MEGSQDSLTDGITPQPIVYIPGEETDFLFNKTDSLNLTEGLNNELSPGRQQHTRAVLTLRYITVVFYLITFIFGVLGNTLTIMVIVKNKKMKTVATCFILNLAVADDLFMLSLPFFAYSTYAKDWVFGSGLCKIMSALYGINLYASIFTMVLMSIDRYLAVVHPLSSIRYRTIKNAWYVCVALWVLCITIMMPYWIYAKTMPQSRYNGTEQLYTCKVFWPSQDTLTYEWFWTNFQLIMGFVLPICIMVFCYLLLLRHLVVESVPLQDQTKRPIRKVTVMVFMVTIVFIVCWTPYHIVRYTSVHKMWVYREKTASIAPSADEMLHYAIFNAIAQALVFLSSCCNPFIYGISSRNFREYTIFMPIIVVISRPICPKLSMKLAGNCFYQAMQILIHFLMFA